MSFSESSSRGRDNARLTNTTRRLVTVDRIERTEVTVTFRNGPVAAKAWVVYGDCGHEITRKVTESPILPSDLAYRYGVGRRKRCPQCLRG